MYFYIDKSFTILNTHLVTYADDFPNISIDTIITTTT